MVWFFFLCAILFVIALLFIVFGPGDLKFPAVICAAILVVGMLLTCWTTVGTRNYGVFTSFNATTGRVASSGLAFKLPWQSVTDIYGGLDTQRYVGSQPNDKKHYLGCIDVRIGDRTNACVSTVLQTELIEDKADTAFKNYRKVKDDDGFDSINEALNSQFVRTKLTVALAETLADYDPLQVPGAVGADGKVATEASPPIQSFSSDVKTALQKKVGSLVDVKSLSLTYIYLSNGTQRRLGQLQAEVANTRIAAQKKLTAANTAAANKALQEGGSKLTPEILTNKCLDILADRTDEKLSIPAGFSCFGPSSTGLVVGAK